MVIDFVPYQEALELKGLGFDEFCFAVSKNHNVETNDDDDDVYLSTVKIPLFSQAFRWFREKYDLDSMIQPTYSTKYQYRMFQVENKTKVQIYGDYMGKEFETYEEAELTCLRKLIKIVKLKQL